jgi:dynein assembly factor 5
MAESELVAQRDLNCLGDDNRQTRKRALTNLSKLPGAGHPPDKLAVLWQETLRAPVLRLFADPVEKNRELAITLASDLIGAMDDKVAEESLTHVMPAIVARIGAPVGIMVEESEELRLLLLELTRSLIKRCGVALATHLPELVLVLVASFSDPFPDAKKEGCACASVLGEAVPGHVETHCAALISGLAPALAHQHSRVRSSATEAIFSLLLHEPSLLVEVAPQLSLIAVDRAPAVREQAVHALAELLSKLKQRRQHASRLLPLLLLALSDEVDTIANHAHVALTRLGDLFAADEADAPPLSDASMSADMQVAAAAASASSAADVSDAATPSAAGDKAAAKAAAKSAAAAAVASAAAAAAAAGGRVAPPMFEGTLFARAPHPASAALVASELKPIIVPVLKDIADWTVKSRLRAAHTLLGTLWYVGPAATEHLDELLVPLMKAIEDDEEAVQLAVRRCVCLLGEACPPGVYVPLLIQHLHSADPDSSSDTAVISRRGMCLNVLSALMSGAAPEALKPQLAHLTAAVAAPHFCIPPPGIDDDRAAVYTGTQLRLCAFLQALVERAGADVAADPQAFSLYCALMRLAAVPSTAGRGFTSQKTAMETLGAFALAAGHAATGPLHATHMPRLVEQLLGDGSAEGSQAPYAHWQAHTSEWHLLQALLRQCDGPTAASQLLVVTPCLARLLDPKQEPVLRGTALALLDALLAEPSFAQAPELDDWAELLFSAMLVPNLVWRAGRAAEHVRLAAMTSLNRLVPLPSLTAPQLEAQLEDALPVLHSTLDDDNVETRRLCCGVVESVLEKLGPHRVESERARKLYPELLKRLDDASDAVRLAVCPTFIALIGAMNYSQQWSEDRNFDKTNFQYMLRGLLVHLDDPAPEIQEAVHAVLARAMHVDPSTFIPELLAVKDRHRSPKLCLELIEAAKALGQVV